MKVIITGSSGMVGRGVLLECLESSHIKEILVINRNSIAMNHPKLKEVLLKDFTQIKTLKNSLKGYDACFHCMGISAVGLTEEKYSEITYGITKELVNLLHELNPNMVFNYVSGTGTDSTENDGIMWARVKGKTENMILKKGFADAYMFRPGIIIPEKGIKSRTCWYNTIYTILRPFFSMMTKSRKITTTTKLGNAMIQVLINPVGPKILHSPEINELSLAFEH